MKLHILGVGQADAIVIELPSGRLAVVDFGHRHLLEYLERLDQQGGVRRFAFCLLTHEHNDHSAALEEFISRYDNRVDEYWFSCALDKGRNAILALHAAAKGPRGCPRGRLLTQGLRDAPVPFTHLTEPNLRVTCFAPSWDEITSSDENDRSVVLRLEYGRFVALLGADAGSQRWGRIIAQAQAGTITLAADLVKAPHHGAVPPNGLPTNLWPTLLRSQESYAVFSVGRRLCKPAKTTIDAVLGRGIIRCTGRSRTCCLDSPVEGQQRAAPDLFAEALQPAWERDWAPSCFGTQIYVFDQATGIRMSSTRSPGFLDACVVH